MTKTKISQNIMFNYKNKESGLGKNLYINVHKRGD